MLFYYIINNLIYFCMQNVNVKLIVVFCTAVMYSMMGQMNTR